MYRHVQSTKFDLYLYIQTAPSCALAPSSIDRQVSTVTVDDDQTREKAHAGNTHARGALVIHHFDESPA